MKRRRRGRPPRDYSDDPDVLVAELAIALQAAWSLSERKALDLALAIHQGAPVAPSKVPHGAKAGLVVGHKLPLQQSFASRSADVDNRGSLDNWMKAGGFPRGIRIPGPVGKTLVWDALELAQHIAQRVCERG